MLSIYRTKAINRKSLALMLQLALHLRLDQAVPVLGEARVIQIDSSIESRTNQRNSRL